jgi:CheY-like chemotaxis protein
MKTAWIVDDDQEMIEAVKLMLRLLDYRLRAFLNARDAAKVLDYGNRPDLLILDINMPGVSGLDFLEYISRKPELQTFPVLMLSTESGDAAIAKAKRLGADAYISKPVTVDELEAAIAQALQKRQSKLPPGA